MANKKPAAIWKRREGSSSKRRIIVSTIIFSLIAGITAIAMRASLPPPPEPVASPQQSSLPLAKEYVYAGGKLVAIYEGSGSGTPPSSSATFLGVNTTTRGNWKSAYGLESFYVVNDSFVLDGNVQLSTNTGTPWSWANFAPASNLSYLQKSGSNLRIAAIWFNDPELVVNLNFADTAQHQVAIYCLDFDQDRTQTVRVYDHATQTPLTAPYTLSRSDFDAGVYVVWNVSGNVDIKATFTSPSPNRSAVISGLFIGGPRNSTLARDTIGLFDGSGTFYLRNSHTGGFADSARSDLTAAYGATGDYPIVGDWNGDGVPTLGVYRLDTFLLRNSNTAGPAEISITFGAAGDLPVVGDWDNNGSKTIGVYRPSLGTFFLKNSNTSGPPDITLTLGIPGDIPVTGDWNGDGIDTVGVFRPSDGTLFLKNANTTGFADIVLTYGIAGDKPVVGDWNGDGIDTIGVYRTESPGAGRFFLRNTNTNGFADLVFYFGNGASHPLAGNWDNLP